MSFLWPISHEHRRGCFLQGKEHHCPEAALAGRGPESQGKEVWEPRSPDPGGCREGSFGKSCLRGFSTTMALKFCGPLKIL